MSEITAIPTAISGTKCPSCDSTKHIKNGKEKGNQKYKCQNCGKHYRSTTGSSIHRIHKKQHINTYIQCINEGLTLRKAAEKTGISLKTSFIWRHKLLAAMHKTRESTLSPRTITAVILTPYSEKGTRKRSNREAPKKVKQILSTFQTDHSGKIRIEMLNSTSRYSLRTLTNINDRAISIPQRKLPKRFKQAGTKKTGNERETANAIQNSLIAWIDKFRGVATKYLHHYWAWFELMHDFELAHNHNKVTAEKCLAI